MREENYLALDIGSGYLKAAHFKIDKTENKIKNISFKKERLEKKDGIFLEDLKENAGHLVEGDENGLLIGLNSEFLKAKTISFTYKRENSNEPINEEEIQKIIQNIENKIFEKIKEQFYNESYLNNELKIVSAKIENIFVDGYPTLDLLGFQGKEIRLGIFNTFTPRAIVNALENLTNSLNLPIISINHLAYSLVRFLAKKSEDFSAVLIDIGANITEIILVKHGLIREIKNLPTGGTSFTQRLSDSLKIGISEAEAIKFQYPEKFSRFFEPNLFFLRKNIELTINELAQLDLLPNLFYIYGGGSLLPDVRKMLEGLINGEIKFLEPEELVNVSALAESSLEILKPNHFSQILNKIIKLIY